MAARKSYYGFSMLPSGFEQRSNYGYNPTSGSYIYKNDRGQQMLDAPWLQKPTQFSGTNFSGNSSQQRGNTQPSPRIQQTMQNQGIQITPAGNRNASNQISITGGTGPTNNSNQNNSSNRPSSNNNAPTNSSNNNSNSFGGFDMEAFLQFQAQAQQAAAERAQQEAKERLHFELTSQAGALVGKSSGYGINDASQINSALGQLYGLQGQAAGSGISMGNVDGAINQLKDLLSQRSSEQNRYEKFVDDFNSSASQAGNYGVNDLDAINAAVNQFQDYQSGATGFNSDLNVDTGFLQSRSGGILDQLQRTLDERSRQQGVVDDTRAGLEDFIGNFGNAYQAVDYRDADQINALESQLDPINSGKIDGIDLSFDFSDLGEQTGGFMDMLSNLRGQRSDDLDDYGSGLSELAASLGGYFGGSQTLPDGSPADSTMPIPEGIINDKPIPDGMPQNNMRDIQSAREVYDLRDQYLEAQRGLDDYGSGERVNKFREQLFALNNQYADVSDALNERQEGIEGRARTFVDELMGMGLTDMSQLGELEGSYNALMGDRNKFDARQSDDELREAMQYMGQQRARLQQEQADRDRNAERERQMGGNTVMTPAFARQFMNDAEYQAFLASLGEARDGPSGAAAATSFARSLGLA